MNQQQARSALTPRSSVMDLSDLRMSLHTDQQSIILNEMSTARKKLEQENQILRDELHDAQLMIRLLKQKLKHAKSGKGGWRLFNSSIVTNRDLKAFQKASEDRLRNKRRNAFDNPSAPGKKTFTKDTSSDGTPSMIVFPSTRDKRRTNTRSDDRIDDDDALAPPMEEAWYPDAPAPPPRRPSTRRPSRRRPTIPDTEANPSSIIDQLARTVIHEYRANSTDSTRSDEWYIDEDES